MAILSTLHQYGPLISDKKMNHCLLEVEVITAPTLRYTQDNQTPIAEMEVSFDGLRPDDPSSELKVVGWGNLAQDLQNRIQVGQKLLLEGRLRMNTIPRQDGTKEKRAELTLSKLNILYAKNTDSNFESNLSKTISSPMPTVTSKDSSSSNTNKQKADWNTSPLIPDTDEIPF